MWVYDNDTVSDTFIVDLTKDRDVQDNLPCNFLSVRNDSSLVAFVYLDNKRVGAVQGYSSDPFIGKNFEIIMIKQPDGDSFAIGDLFLQVGKNEQMSSTPYNPSWDLIEENINVYASGCDSRICYSAALSIDLIKYWINAQNNKIVQRRLDIQGSASLGTYEITFSTDTILTGGTPINGEVLETKLYKTIIIDSIFDYSVTNCSIKGWMIDFLLGSDISSDYTIVTGGATVINAYDDDLTTSFSATISSGSWVTKWEVSFPSRSIDEVHAFTILDGASGYTNQYRLMGNIDGVWTQIGSTHQAINGGKTFYIHDTSLNLLLVTGLRIQNAWSGSNAVFNLHDITVR